MSSVATADAADREIVRDFRAAMSVITEQACRDGKEMEVLEALFPVMMPGIGDHGTDHPL